MTRRGIFALLGGSALAPFVGLAERMRAGVLLKPMTMSFDTRSLDESLANLRDLKPLEGFGLRGWLWPASAPPDDLHGHPLGFTHSIWTGPKRRNLAKERAQRRPVKLTTGPYADIPTPNPESPT